jgi:capsular exopolysaccharide synthesis family protein
MAYTRFSLDPSLQTNGLRRLPERDYAAYPNVTPADTPTGLETESLFDYARILLGNYRTLLVAMLIGILGAALVTLPEAPVYRARTTLEIQGLNNEFLNTKQVSPVSDDGSNSSIIADIQTQIKIINSEFLVDRVVDRLKAAGKLKPLNRNNRPSIVPSLFRASAPVPDDAVEQFHRTALRNLTVSQISQTRVIEVLFKAPDPSLAADFVNTLDAEYIESNIEARWKMSEHTSEWLGHQLDDTRGKLERSELNLQRYARRSGLLFTSADNQEKTNVAEEKLTQLQGAVSRAQELRSLEQSRYEIAKAASPDSLADVLNDQTLRDLQRQITDLRRQQAELNSLYTAKYERVERIAVQIAPLEEAFRRERASILDRIRNDYQTALRQEELLRVDYQAQSAVILDQADKSIQYNILKRDVDSNRQLYESMLQQFKASSVASVMRASNIRIIDPGKVRSAPYTPNLKINIALGAIAGLVFGVAFVLIRRNADRTLQQPGDVNFWTRLSELGVIPTKSLTGGDRASGWIERAGLSGTRASPSRKQIGATVIDSKSLPQIRSVLAEAFRNVLTSVLFSGQNGTSPRVLVVTSANPGEGKTTVTANLAVALAEIRLKVLVVDADLRKPRMHELFELDNERGLSSILNAETLTIEEIDHLIQGTKTRGVHVLPSGPPTHAAANLLHSPHLEQILAELKNHFDMILIDTPPAIQLTDSRIVGRLADAVILVTRAGRTTRDDAIAVAGRFAEDRTHLLGAILNDWKPKGRGQIARYYDHYHLPTSYAPSDIANPQRT